ncbi:choice-of-anchor J domain-containing protein [uncultured Fluviicola sp.]|uniref:T9SS-dependent choice-of-anchor J family protein n=1 Tax=uncultured Fluviicola sp. TaxID=463303 RepID=UPI0025D003CE|nr:choice-of-anchor J domain-containing protein [uncultured Fluviicola sp.]
MLKQIAFLSSVLISALSANAQTTILDEDFQQGIPASWTVIKNDPYTEDISVSEFSPGWIALANPDSLLDTVAGATSYFTTNDKASRWLISPPVTIGTFGNYLKWKAKSYDPSYPDTYQVLISTTDTQISSFNDTLLRVEFEWEEWTEHEVNLSEMGYSNNETVHIAFVLETIGGFKLFLDSINIRKDDPLALEEQALQPDVTIYPNPTSETIYFSANNLKNVAVYNTAGALIYSQEKSTPISLETLDRGMYLVRMTTNNGQVITKRVQKI